MMKKMAIGLIFFLTMVTLSTPAWATSCYVLTWDDDNAGYYVDGNLKLTVTFKDYLSATITLPNLGNVMDLAGESGYGESFYFGSQGDLSDYLLYESIGDIGTWDQSGCNLYMDFSNLADALYAMLPEGIDAEIVGSTKATAKIASNGTNSGKITIKINIYSPLEGNISFTLTFKGYPFEFTLDKKAAQSLKRGGSSVKPELKNFLSSVFSNLPKKGADPGLLPSHKK